jgi:Uma2 family endonuclease
MTVAPASKKLTYEDYLLLPEGDGLQYEIIDGELFVTAAPIPRHQKISGNLFLVIGPYVEAHDCGELYFGPLDVVMSNHDVVQPDLLYIANEHSDLMTKKNLQGVPDFAVEILSESTRRKDEVLKLKRYELFGVAEYWIVDPKRDRIRVYKRDGEQLKLVNEASAENDDVLTAPFFPGLDISVRRVFATRR